MVSIVSEAMETAVRLHQRQRLCLSLLVKQSFTLSNPEVNGLLREQKIPSEGKVDISLEENLPERYGGYRGYLVDFLEGGSA